MDLRIRQLNDPDILVPDDSLSALQHLWAYSDPFAQSATESIFLEAIKQCTEYHYSRNPFYKKWLSKNQFTPSMICTLEDILKIPFLHANFYKSHVVKTAQEKDIVLNMTSSGTTGKKSQMFFDDWTIFASDKSVDKQFDYFGLITDNTVNYLLYSYEPIKNVNLGTLRTRQMMRRYAKEKDVVYALKYTGKEYEFDLFGCIDALLRFAKEEKPVRLLGFPAFLYFTLEKMKDMGHPPLKLHPESLVMMGGGWKGFVDKKMSSTTFRNYIQERLGIATINCRESYGAVEHGVGYIDCPHHHFHVPIYSRAFVRDVTTLKVLPFGESGFLNVISPINTTIPVLSLLLGDLTVMHEGSRCGCGIKSPYFEILDRAGITANKSCAIAASELLKKR